MQKNFSDLEYAASEKLTRRDRFSAEIDNVIPWGKLHKLVEPFYPKVEGAGRPPTGVARMLRMYVAQRCLACRMVALKMRSTIASPSALLSATV